MKRRKIGDKDVKERERRGMRAGNTGRGWRSRGDERCDKREIKEWEDERKERE